MSSVFVGLPRQTNRERGGEGSSRTRCGAPTKRVRRVLAPLQALRGRAERGTGTVGTLLSIQARSTSWSPRSSHARTAGDVSRDATERPAARAGILGNIDARGPRTPPGSRGPRRAARLRLLRHSRGDGVRTARTPSPRPLRTGLSETPVIPPETTRLLVLLVLLHVELLLVEREFSPFQDVAVGAAALARPRRDAG